MPKLLDQDFIDITNHCSSNLFICPDGHVYAFHDFNELDFVQKQDVVLHLDKYVSDGRVTYKDEKMNHDPSKILIHIYHKEN